MPVPRKPSCATRRGAACPSILVVLCRSRIVQQSQTSHGPHLTSRQNYTCGRVRLDSTKKCDSAPELGTIPPHCLRAHDTSTRTDGQTRLFFLSGGTAAKNKVCRSSRLLDPGRGRAGQGGRSNAHQSAGSNADGSNGAEWIEQCIMGIVLVPAFARSCSLPTKENG